MKRLVETTRWRDPWFRRLSPLAKLLFCYLTDNCDQAGLMDLDLDAAQFDIGAPIKSEHIAELADRVQRLEDGKLFLPRFIVFQCGTLSENCPAHKPVLKLVEERKLTLHGKCYAYPTATLPLGYAYGSDRVPVPYMKGKGKEKERKGKENAAPVSALVPTPEDIYGAYPRKVAKPEALRAITRAMRRRGAAYLLERTIAYAKTQTPGDRFTPHPATWFNQCRFDDDPATWVIEPSGSGNGGSQPAKPKAKWELEYEESERNRKKKQ